MERAAWWATVHGVARIWPQLSTALTRSARLESKVDYPPQVLTTEGPGWTLFHGPALSPQEKEQVSPRSELTVKGHETVMALPKPLVRNRCTCPGYIVRDLIACPLPANSG